MEKVIKVMASQVFDDNNDGFIYGLEYYDTEMNDYFPIDCEWFKTSSEREAEIKYLKRENPNLIVE